MKVFPMAIQNALDALNTGNTQKTMAIMAEGYNTFIIEKAVIPLPLLAAQDMIAKASLLDKNKKDEATKLLDESKHELEKAEVLGYTNSSTLEYKALNDAIDAVTKEIKGKNEVVKLYDHLKDTKKFETEVKKDESQTIKK